MTTNLQKLTFFCLRHQETCSAPRSTAEVLCDQGPHVISENYLQQKWDYCCSCQSFFARNDGDAAKDRCLACDREIIARYLCESCDTLSFDTLDTPLRREFSLSPDWLPVPSCPCCLRHSRSQAREHLCPCLRVAIKTARPLCPFCEERFDQAGNYNHEFPASFYRPAAYYLDKINGSGFRAGYSEARQNALAAKADGIFWLTAFERDSSYLIFPSVRQVEAAQRLFAFEKAFDCENPAAGELWIVRPAVALFDQATGEFSLAQKGMLEVRAVEAPPLHVPPPLPVEPPPVYTAVQAEPFVSADGGGGLQPPAIESVEKRGSKVTRLALACGGLVVLLVIAGFVITTLNSTTSKIISKIKQGELVTPAGNSAYDLYLQANLSDGDKTEIRAVAGPALESSGSSFIAKIAKESYEPSNADSDQMIRTYSWLDSLDPRNSYKARKRYFQGWQYYQNKDYKNAGNEFAQASNLDSSWAMPVNKMAHVAMRNRDYYAAQGYYEKANQLDPKWIIPLVNLGMLVTENQYGIKNYYTGENAARRALEIDPNKASAYYILGRSLEGQGRDCEALSAYRTAIDYGRSIPNPGFNVTTLSKAVDRMAARLSC